MMPNKDLLSRVASVV